MNAPALLRRLASLPRPSPRARAAAPVHGRRASRLAVLSFAAAVPLLFAGLTLTLDHAVPKLRDPEYGRRVGRYNARVAENPGRPAVLVLGCSRVAHGVRPDAWEATTPAPKSVPASPLLFNMALVGSGPVMQLMAFRRAVADGLTPDAVLIEYWPPFLRQDGTFGEEARIDTVRLLPADRPLVRDYFRDPDATFAAMRKARVHPWYETRARLLAQMNPKFLPWDKWLDGGWKGLDPWGWLPGLDEDPPRPDLRPGRLAHFEAFYRHQFAGFRVDPLSDRALHALVSEARDRGAKVGVLVMPEASEFRAWYPPAVEAAARDHLAAFCRETGLPLIDARTWMPDAVLPDGFHLSRVGAAAFTRKLGPAVAAAFPDLKPRGVP